MHSDRPQVFIANGFDYLVVQMFAHMGFGGTKDIMMADFVVFTGGADISPSLYHEHPIMECGRIDALRDATEVKVFKAAQNYEIPMVGICRGAQLLNVMNGGRLWQDVDGHVGNHQILDERTGDIITVTSTHHQQMRPTHDAEVLAWAYAKDATSLCTTKLADGLVNKVGDSDRDAEVVWYEKSKSLCFQPHPEFYTQGADTLPYFQRLLKEFIYDVDKSVAKSA